jgi:glutaminyl-peptide cyclotransferase
MKYNVYFISIIILLFASCCNKKTRIHDVPVLSGAPVPLAKLMSPMEGETFRCGDSVHITMKIQHDSLPFFDSVTVSSGSYGRQVYRSGFESLYWKSSQARTGNNILKISLYKRSQKETHTVNLTLLSDIIPAVYKYKVIRQYPHDKDAYTEGLIYDNGLLYESTGPEGKSSLRIVTLKTGIPERRLNLDNEFFGEGIAIFKDQIYQLTYKTQVGFIYNKESLDLIRRFDYPIKEGWGLTSDGQRLIMSDGSARLYFMEPEYFTQVDQVEVFDNNGMINNLNELEFIKGKVLANIWYKSTIVIIDPANGKITGTIDLEKLMPPEYYEDSNKVLNGIAYNPSNGHIYVTGKNWTVLYELEIIPSF